MKRSYSLQILKSHHKQLSQELKDAKYGVKKYIGNSKKFWKKCVKQLEPMIADLEKSITKLKS